MTNKTTASNIVLVAMATGQLLSACAVNGESLSSTDDAPGFETFKASVPRDSLDGAYIVEDDIPLHGEEALRAYYDRLYYSDDALSVRLERGSDDRWPIYERRHLTYCIGASFGHRKESVVLAMEAAAAEWEAVADVEFIHVPTEDDTCTATNRDVTFDINQTEEHAYHARSFFPSYPATARHLLIDTSAYGQRHLTLKGILLHELGHILGLAHEHIRSGDRDCREPETVVRGLTSYDVLSVMHYARCGKPEIDYKLTDLDRQGIARLYPEKTIPVPADYDGDGKVDLSTKDDDGFWRIDYAANGYGQWDAVYDNWGGATFHPVPADYDYDGRADLAVKDDSGRWHIDYSRGGFDDVALVYTGWGGASFLPVPGDYDGDGSADLAVKDDRGLWHIDFAADGYHGVTTIYDGWGGATFHPVPSDYDGDGTTDLAVKDDTGRWHIDYSRGGFDDATTVYSGWGGPSFHPVPGDYDGDGSVDLAVKDDNGNWHIDYSRYGGFSGVNAVYSGWGDVTFLPYAVRADNADSSADLLVWKSANHSWHLDRSSVGGGFAGADLVIGEPR